MPMKRTSHLSVAVGIASAALFVAKCVPAQAESFQTWVTAIFGASAAAKTVYTTKPTYTPYAAPAGTEWLLISWESPQLPTKTRWEWVLDTSGKYMDQNVTAADFPSAAKYGIHIVGIDLVQGWSAIANTQNWAHWMKPSRGWTIAHKPPGHPKHPKHSQHPKRFHGGIR